MMGAERRSMVMTEDEKKLTAYHEAGHAIVAVNEPASDPIHKATIIPRGRALGLVMRLPEGDRVSLSRDRILADLSVSMGGRIAEELIFGHDKVTTGASSDIQFATNMARRMVTEWGLSDEMGPLKYGKDAQDAYMGHAPKDISDETARKIDSEIRRIVEEAYQRAKTLLEEHLDALHTLAKALLEYETLSGDDITRVLNGEKLVREEDAPSKKTGGPSGSVPTGGINIGTPKPQGSS